jgi:serine/threonine protein kinase/cephalosporin-C deacetylase-like acetyl esterase
MIGQTLSHYRVEKVLGRGGMGDVYLAEDTKLTRKVAVKILPADMAASEQRKQRFLREARTASALNHPNIVTIYDMGVAVVEGVERDFIVMEYVEGKPLSQVIPSEGLPLDIALRYATEISDALSGAHEVGVVHRDIKPANIMVSKKDQIRVLDFGLAKLVEPSEVDESAPTLSAALRTEEGTVLGTAAYMSPEQAEGKATDARSDVFSFGSVLFEMFTGRRPFQGDSQISVRMAILSESPPSLRSLRKEAPKDMERIVSRCLEKNKEERYASGKELHEEILRYRSELAGAGLKRLFRQPRVWVPGALSLMVAVSVGSWLWTTNSRMRWAKETALPEIASLNEEEDYVAAFHLAQEVQRLIPDDRELQQLRSANTWTASIETDPSAVEVYWKGYSDIEGRWYGAGRTPILDGLFPAAYLRWRFVKEGFETVEAAGWAPGGSRLVLQPKGEPPRGMVRVPGGKVKFGGEDEVELADYWIDRYEVTNREFKTFVDAGGYEKRDYWKYPFARKGRQISWQEALAEFRDETGRPGPATWELGTYPDGEEDYPVGGVSWYEAVAFCESVGKSLPTVYHWYKANDLFAPSDILVLSNFDGEGPVRVGSRHGLGPYGTYDTAGNVKEWSWNRTENQRYVLGGAWDEPDYLYASRFAEDPFERSPTHGIRCAEYTESSSEILGAVDRPYRDYTKETPVGDEVFESWRRIYSYDRTELEAVTEPLNSGSPHWKKERITFDAAYGSERVPAYLFLPSHMVPPYQTVIFFPGSGAFYMSSHENVQMRFLDFIIRSGRALLYPVYKGMHEKRVDPASLGPNDHRDLVIQWAKDLGRSLDYLETRDDIDPERLAYYGFSLGARYGPIMTAIDQRFKASVLLVGGLWQGSTAATVPPSMPEIDSLHFAPRSKVPVLMLNTRNDFVFPLETSQLPLLELLGAPQEHKKHVVFEGGHMPPRTAIIRETLDWLDRYLGPVEAKK